MIIGQADLLNKLNQYTLMTLPKALLLIGDTGCGKHTFAQYLASRLELEYEEVLKDFSLETFFDYQQAVTTKLCVIDIDSCTEARQNIFLKLLEEPPQNIYFVVIAISEFNILPTILNRVVKYYFLPYSKEELQQICPEVTNEILYTICNTPGQLLEVNQLQFNEALSIAKTFVDTVDTLATKDILSYALKFNYKEEYDKLDPNLFFKLVAYYASYYYKQTYEEKYQKIYSCANSFLSKLSYKILNKENLMYNFLLNINYLFKEM